MATRPAKNKKGAKTAGAARPARKRKAAEPEPKLILSVRPIPAPLFGVNLRSFLGDHRWRKLRQSLLPEYCRQCQTCGSLVENSSKLHAHEEWSFDAAAEPVVAKVINIKFVCWLCHACEHFMHTISMVKDGTVGEEALQDVVAHFAKVNGVGTGLFDSHLNKAMKEWPRLSRRKYVGRLKGSYKRVKTKGKLYPFWTRFERGHRHTFKCNLPVGLGFVPKSTDCRGFAAHINC